MEGTTPTITRTLLTTSALVAVLLGAPGGGEASATPAVGVLEDYGRLPLSFEENRGQTDAQVRFLSRGSGYTLFLTPTEVVLRLRAGEVPGEGGHRKDMAGTRERGAGAVLRMSLVGAHRSPEMSGTKELPGRSHYFIGKDPAAWRSDVPSYARVRYHEVYPGIDVVYYGNQGQLEYDFVVQPGGDPDSIRLRFEGADDLRLDEAGNLILTTAAGELIEKAPVLYQEVDGARRAVEGRYLRRGEREVGFEVGAYDREAQLLVDPVLMYSTYLGGISNDSGSAIAVDGSGSAYVTGYTYSANFPAQGPYQTDQGGTDAFVTKLSPDGGSLVYSTYLGGGGNDSGSGIAVDGSGSSYVTGATLSTDFPTLGPYQIDQGDTDVFVTKLAPDGGSLAYSTYLGGNAVDGARGIAVDGAGSAYVTGDTASTDFPTQDSYQTRQGGWDVIVTKLSPSGGSLVYSTYLGGSGDDYGFGIAVDGAGRGYVAGYTASPDFPTLGQYQTGQGGSDAFVTKLASTFRLDVDLASVLNGSGQVDVTPGGICANTPGAGEHCEYWYSPGTDVTLTETPASDSVFAGWGGDCSGLGPCTVTMSVDRAVTADFRGPCLTPPTFGGLTSATDVSAGTCAVDLDWGPATPVCGTEVTYSVYRSDSSGFTPGSSSRIASGLSLTSYTDAAGVVNSDSYYYIVRATDVSNGEQDTNVVQRSVALGACTTAPPEELEFFTVCSGDGQNALDWVNPVAGYASTWIVYRTDGVYPTGPGDGTPVDPLGFPGTPGDVDGYTHTGLANDTTYTYAAYVYDGTSQYSAGKDSFGRPAIVPVVVKWGYDTGASALGTVGVVPDVSYHVVSNDRGLHGVLPGPLGGMWPLVWRPLAMNGPAQDRPSVVPLPTTTVMGASSVGLVSSQDGRVYAFDGDTGKALWASPVLGGMLQGAPSATFKDYEMSYDLVMVGTRDGAADNALYALNLADGSVAWSFDNGGNPTEIGIISGQVSIDYANDRVYFTSEQRGSLDTVWALSFTSTSATYLWSQNLGNVHASPILRGSRLYVGTNAGFVHAMDPLTGAEPYWGASHDAGDGAVKGLVWPDAATSRLYFSTDGEVHAIEMSDGTDAWTPVPITNVSPLLLWNGKAYAGGNDSRLYAIDVATSAVTSVQLGDPLVTKVVGTPTYDVLGGVLLVGTNLGVVYGVALGF